MEELRELIEFIVKMLSAFLEYLGVAQNILDEHNNPVEDATGDA